MHLNVYASLAKTLVGDRGLLSIDVLRQRRLHNRQSTPDARACFRWNRERPYDQRLTLALGWPRWLRKMRQMPPHGHDVASLSSRSPKKAPRRSAATREIWNLIQARGLYARGRGKTPWGTVASKLATDPAVFERTAPDLYRLRR